MEDRERVKEKMAVLMELTDEFADLALDDDYRSLCQKLIKKMGRKQQVPFLSGRIEIWAAAVVYSIGQINFLFDRSFSPYVTADDICDHFGTSKSTTSQKAKLIRDMFKMRYFDDDFSTQSTMDDNPITKLMMNMSVLPPATNIVEQLTQLGVFEPSLEDEDEDSEDSEDDVVVEKQEDVEKEDSRDPRQRDLSEL
ncbi:MAG: DUF6398 domain-containing protein [Methanosarcinaceae archaeon]